MICVQSYHVHVQDTRAYEVLYIVSSVASFQRPSLCGSLCTFRLTSHVRVRVCWPVQDTPAYEVLYKEDSIIRGKLSEKRAQQEAEINKDCTFAPQLVSQQLVKEGRVMRVGD